MKRLLIIIIVLLVGCSSDLDYQAADDDMITWWCENRYSHVDNMAASQVYQRLMTQTKTDIMFVHPQSGEHRERFLVLMRQEVLPDIISHDFVNDYPGGIEKALTEQVIIPLNDLIDSYCPHLKLYLEEHPDVLSLVSTQSGQIFCFPSVQEERGIRTYIGPFIRKDHLEQINLEAPTTLDDYHEVLLALKNLYHETPLTFYGGKIMDTDFLISAYDLSWGYYVEEGVVKHGVLEARFYDFMQTLKAWYDEGLISTGVFTDSSKVYTSKAKKNQYSMFVDYVSRMEVYEEAIRESFVPLLYPVEKVGDMPFSGHITPKVLPYSSVYITRDNHHLEETAKLLDYFYSEEGQRLFNFGLEGQTYQMVNHEPVYMETFIDSEESFSSAVKKYTVSGPYIRMQSQFNQMLVQNNQKQAITLWSHTEADSHKIYNLILPSEQALFAGDVNHSLDERILEFVKDYVLDDLDENSIIDFQKTLRALGVDQVIEYYQEAYDACN